MQFWASFGTSFLYYSRKWGGLSPPVLKVGTYPPVPPPALTPMHWMYNLYMLLPCMGSGTSAPCGLWVERIDPPVSWPGVVKGGQTRLCLFSVLA